MTLDSKFPLSRKLLLLIGDLFLIALGGYLPFLLVINKSIFHQAMISYYELLPILIIAAGLLLNINGMMTLKRKRYGQVLVSVGVVLFELLIFIMASSFAFRMFSYPRSVLLLAFFLQFILLAIWKYPFWRIENDNAHPKKILIVGSEEDCLRMIYRLQRQPNRNYQLQYTCQKFNKEILDESAYNIDCAILMPTIDLQDKAEMVNYCQSTEKQIIIVPENYEMFCYGFDLDQIDDIPVFRIKYLQPNLEQRALKRLLDVAVVGIGLMVLWPVFVFVALAIKITSRGPIFYSQIRTGRAEREFRVYKFRSMIQNAELSTGPVLAAENDNRITPIGKLLRATRLDELPQLLNVLKGDMSIVGPRPERPIFVEQFKKEIQGYAFRHNVKPGITGMAQIYGKYNTTPEDKLIYDLIYIQNCSLITDLVLIIQTFRVLITKSSTEGVKTSPKKLDLSKYQLGN